MISYDELSSHLPETAKPLFLDSLSAFSAPSELFSFPIETAARAIMRTIGNPHHWADACTSIAEATSSAYCTLSSVVDGDNTPRFGCHSVQPHQFPTSKQIASYMSRGERRFALEWPDMGKARAPLSTAVHACGCLVDFGRDGLWLLRIARRPTTPGFNEDDLRQLNGLLPFVEASAFSSHQVFDAALTTLKRVHSQIGMPFAALDTEGKMLVSNDEFERKTSSHFSVVQSVLRPLGHADCVAFKAALKSLGEDCLDVEVALRDGTSPCIAHLKVLSDIPGRVSRSPLVSLTVRGLSERKLPSAGTLAKLYGLTRMEAEVAAHLATATSVGNIARRRDVSVGTIRVQLKGVFRKLRVTSQIELVAKLQGSGI